MVGRAADAPPRSFSSECLLAWRLVEGGMRFGQVNSAGEVIRVILS